MFHVGVLFFGPVRRHHKTPCTMLSCRIKLSGDWVRVGILGLSPFSPFPPHYLPLRTNVHVRGLHYSLCQSGSDMLYKGPESANQNDRKLDAFDRKLEG